MSATVESAVDATDVILRDGSTLRLRAPAAEDADALLEFFSSLSEHSRYLRFHGATGKYRGRYGKRALRPFARSLLRFDGDAWVYFNNDRSGHAIRDALDLSELLGEAYDARASPAYSADALRDQGRGAAAALE